MWVVLVAPDQPQYLSLSAFLRLPLEGLVLIALALVLPASGRRILAVIVGLGLTLVVVLKVIDYEVFTTFDRPFDPIGDTSQLGNGIETLRVPGRPDGGEPDRGRRGGGHCRRCSCS